MTNGENTANILLQRLVREVTKLWNGEPSEIKTAEDARYYTLGAIANIAGERK